MHVQASQRSQAKAKDELNAEMDSYLFLSSVSQEEDEEAFM